MSMDTKRSANDTPRIDQFMQHKRQNIIESKSFCSFCTKMKRMSMDTKRIANDTPRIDQFMQHKKTEHYRIEVFLLFRQYDSTCSKIKIITINIFYEDKIIGRTLHVNQPLHRDS